MGSGVECPVNCLGLVRNAGIWGGMPAEVIGLGGDRWDLGLLVYFAGCTAECFGDCGGLC